MRTFESMFKAGIADGGIYNTVIRMPFDKLAAIHAYNCKALPSKFPVPLHNIKKQMCADLVNVAKTGVDLKDEDGQWAV